VDCLYPVLATAPHLQGLVVNSGRESGALAERKARCTAAPEID
jgi:hypothetical protein